MRNLGALQAELAAFGMSDLVVLLELKTPTPIYRARRIIDGGWDGTFGGNTYVPDAFEVSEIEHGLLGQRPAFTVTLQNVTHPSTGAARPWSTLLNVDLEEINGFEVVVRVAKISLLVAGDEDSVLTEQLWYIDGGSIENEVVKIRCAPPADALAWEVPVFSIISETCGWRFKESPCFSQSELTTCPKTLEACIVRHGADAPLPFGPGWPFYYKQTRRRVAG